ncbi:hypothetical protein DPSP01_013146 [Paraphaeosphaeria sporulosa]
MDVKVKAKEKEELRAKMEVRAKVEPAGPASSTSTFSNSASSTAADVESLFTHQHLLEQAILTCGALPPDPNPLVEAWINLVRDTYLQNMCRRWIAMGIQNKPCLIHGMDMLCMAYSPRLGGEIIKPFKPLTRWLNHWPSSLTYKGDLDERPPLHGKGGILKACGVQYYGGKQPGFDVLHDARAFRKEMRLQERTMTQRKLVMSIVEKKVGAMRATVQRVWKKRYDKESEVVEKYLEHDQSSF